MEQADPLKEATEAIAARGQPRIAAAPAVPLDRTGIPIGPCPSCRGGLFWSPADRPPEAGPWRCLRCQPMSPGTPHQACAVPAPRPLSADEIDHLFARGSDARTPAPAAEPAPIRARRELA
jgi:hypothetical protein